MGYDEWVGWPTPTWSGQLCVDGDDGVPLGKGRWERMYPWVSVVAGVSVRVGVSDGLPGANVEDDSPHCGHGLGV